MLVNLLSTIGSRQIPYRMSGPIVVLSGHDHNIAKQAKFSPKVEIYGRQNNFYTIAISLQYNCNINH